MTSKQKAQAQFLAGMLELYDRRGARAAWHFAERLSKAAYEDGAFRDDAVRMLRDELAALPTLQ